MVIRISISNAKLNDKHIHTLYLLFYFIAMFGPYRGYVRIIVTFKLRDIYLIEPLYLFQIIFVYFVKYFDYHFSNVAP